MNIRFLGNSEIYQMDVTIQGAGLVQIHPQQYPGLDVDVGFEIITPKGSVFGRYLDYTTVYRRMDDGSIILSNDGRVWMPPVVPELDPEPEPTWEELAEMERQEQIMSTQSEIDTLKLQLDSTDYKIVKTYEYSLVGMESDYDVDSLHAERQALRDQINAKEAELQSLMEETA